MFKGTLYLLVFELWRIKLFLQFNIKKIGANPVMKKEIDKLINQLLLL